MRSHFDEQLNRLNEELIVMGAMCEEAIAAAIRFLLDGDETMDKKVFSTDSEIDHKEREIEGLCMKLLLQQQPVARDLRTISSALKMISDMERIGDQASDIAEIAKYIKDSPTTGKVHIREMAEAASKMVVDSVESFVKKDLGLAWAVMRYDDVVDDLFDQVRQELVALIAAHTEAGEACIDLLMVAKYLERIGDHAVNIAEWVEYSILGTHRSNNEV